MNQRQQLSNLTRLSALLLDSRLAALQLAAKEKLGTEAQLAALMKPQPPGNAGLEIAEALAGINYQRWADARRSALNMTLARQTVAWADARDHAREAFGKKQALDGLTIRQSPTQHMDD